MYAKNECFYPIRLWQWQGRHTIKWGANSVNMLAALAQWLRESNIFRQICKSTSEWREFESRSVGSIYQSGFEFAKTLLLVVGWYFKFNGELVLFCVRCCVSCKRLSLCRSELIDSAWVVIVPGQKCIKNNNNV